MDRDTTPDPHPSRRRYETPPENTLKNYLNLYFAGKMDEIPEEDLPYVISWVNEMKKDK